MGFLRCCAPVLLLLMVAVPPGIAMLPAAAPDGPGEGFQAHAGAAAWRDPAVMQGAAAAPGTTPDGLSGPLVPFHPAAGIRMEPGVAWRPLAPGEFTFRCPTGPEGAGIVDMDDPTNNVNIVRGGCPFRIIDEGDLLGSPQLAVRHDDVDEVAFFSLHGGAAEDGPTPRSRVAQTPATNSGQTHTVFTSADGGWLWQDNPYGREGLGETASGVITRDGNIFVASLFSKPMGDDENGVPLFDYHVRLHEEQTVHDTPLAHRGPRIDNRAPGNQIEEVNLVLVTPPKYVENAAQYEQYVNGTQHRPNGTAAPSNDTQVGRYAMPRDPGDHSGDLVAAVWHERAYDWRNASTGKSSWIHVMWRSAWDRDEWKVLDDAQLIGPCRAASDPVAWNGRIYVACVVDAGYAGRRDARIGDVDIWAIDPAAGTKHFMSHVRGLGDGRPRLTADEEGRFAISTTSILPSGDVDFSSVRLAWGWYGRKWDSAFDIGYQINEQWAPAGLREARVTAMEIVRMEDKHIVFLSFMQRLNSTISSDDPRAAAPVEYRKLVGSWEHCRASATALYDLNVGIVRHPFEEGLVNNLTGVFDDLHDGMAYVHDDATGMHLLHFAYGDHGAIQYGIVDARSAAGDCREELAPMLYAAPPPAPQAVFLSTGIGIGTALGSTAVAGLMLGSVLVAKRRVAMAAAAKSK